MGAKLETVVDVKDAVPDAWNNIENVRGRWATKVYDNGRQIKSRVDLQNTIFIAWKTIDFDCFQGMYRSISSRLISVDQNRSLKTSYYLS